MSRFPSNPAIAQGFQAQASFVSEFMQRSLEAARRLGELNAHVVEQLLTDSAEASHQILACSNPMQAMAVALTASQPAFEHLRTYQDRLLSLVTVFPEPGGRAVQHQQRAERNGGGRGYSVSGGDMLTNASRADDAASAAGYTRVH